MTTQLLIFELGHFYSDGGPQVDTLAYHNRLECPTLSSWVRIQSYSKILWPNFNLSLRAFYELVQAPYQWLKQTKLKKLQAETAH